MISGSRRGAASAMGGRRRTPSTWTPAVFGTRLIHYGEARAPENTIDTGDIATLAGLFGSAVSLGSESSTVRPSLATAPMLNGGSIAYFDGVDEWLRSTAADRPRIGMLLMRQVVWESGFPIVSYGSGNYPRLRKSGISNRVEFNATTTTIASQPAATLSDEYYRVVLFTDDGATQTCSLYDGALDPATVVTDSDANANARSADGQTLSLGAFVTGTSPAEIEVCAALFLNDVITAGEITSMLDYWRTNLVETGTPCPVPFIGTLSTNANAQPRPYPPLHEAMSGNTVTAVEDRLCGFWGGGGGTTIGSADDPGPGNRGSMETLATTDSNPDIVALILAGTNDASSGAIDSTTYERFVRRLFAVAGVTPASALKVFCGFVTPRTDGAGVPQGRIDTFNNTTLPAIIATLQGASFDVDTWDPVTGFDTGTMLLADGLHPNLLGAQHVAQAAYDVLDANGLLTGGHRIVLIGDSITAGGTNLIPQVTAQYRPWLARYIAAGGYI